MAQDTVQAGDVEVEDTRPVMEVTPGQLRVLHQFLRDGATNQEIGRRLYISEDTVKSHMKALLLACGAKTRTGMMALIMRDKVRVVIRESLRDPLK